MTPSPSRGPLIIAHRGDKGSMPENTRPAFARALEVGADLIELDVVLTRDDHPVVVHDLHLSPDLARAPDGRFVTAPGPAIRSLDLAELRRYDLGAARPGSAIARDYPDQAQLDGVAVPTFAEVLALTRPHPGARLLVEIKSDPAAPDLCAAPGHVAARVLADVDAAAMRGRVILQSFDWRVVEALRGLAPEMTLGCLSWVDEPFMPGPTEALPGLAHRLGANMWAPYHLDLTAPLLAEARALGLLVFVWTVNSPEDLDRAFALGPDGIITDFPSRAMRRRTPIPA